VADREVAPMTAWVPGVVTTARGDRDVRSRLLGVTVELAAESGLGAVTVRGLCVRADVAPRTFYRYFADVRGAFLAACLQMHQELRTAIAVAYAADGTAGQRALACAEALVAFVQDDPTRANALFVQAPAGGIEVEALRAETVEWAIGLLTGVPHEVVSGADPWERRLGEDSTHRLLAEMAVGGVSGLVWRRLVQRQVDRLDDAVPYIVEALLQPYEWSRQRDVD
jgi:AcrR family transcriptional regulator